MIYLVINLTIYYVKRDGLLSCKSMKLLGFLNMIIMTPFVPALIFNFESR